MWAGATSAEDYAPAVFTVAFKPTARLEQWDGGAVSVHRGALLLSYTRTQTLTITLTR
jgi:hypothetical protein